MKDKTVLTVNTQEDCVKPKYYFDLDGDEYYCTFVKKCVEKYNQNISPDCPRNPLPLPISIKQYLEETKQTSAQ